MKLFKISLITLTLALFASSCVKDADIGVIIPSESIQGIWKGAYGFGGQEPSHYYSFHIKNGGEIEEYNISGVKTASGTWTLNGQDFSATLKYTASGNTYLVSAHFYSATSKLEGTWGYSSPTSGGKWYMIKQ